MTLKQRFVLWILAFGFSLYHLFQFNVLTTFCIWILAVWVELESERADRERDRREHAEDCTRGYIQHLSGGRRRQSRPARVIGMSDSNENGAA